MAETVYVVGTGPGSKNLLTSEASAVIMKADLIIGAPRMTQPYRAAGRTCIDAYLPDEVRAALEQADCRTAAVLMSGDTGFYSGARALVSALPDTKIQIIPGVSSLSYFCAKLAIPWHEVHVVSLHGSTGSPVRAVASNRYTFFLLDRKYGIAELCSALTEFGLGDCVVHTGENLSGGNEQIGTGTAKQFTGYRDTGLAVLLAENNSPDNRTYREIPDGAFLRGAVPMTKCEVRSAVTAKLAISRRDICWDIGAGTGSVSVAMALMCPEGRVYAVECNPEAVGLIRSNQLKFQCDNIVVANGRAADAVKKLPKPDCVFVGGSKGEMAPVLKAAAGKNPAVRVVISAITLETLSEALGVLKQLGWQEPGIVQLGAAHTRTVGGYHMLTGENPIFLLTGGERG